MSDEITMREKFEGETDAEVEAEDKDIESVRPNKTVYQVDRGIVVGTFLVLADDFDDALVQANRLLEKRHDTVSRIQGIKEIDDIFVPPENW